MIFVLFLQEIILKFSFITTRTVFFLITNGVLNTNNRWVNHSTNLKLSSSQIANEETIEER